MYNSFCNTHLQSFYQSFYNIPLNVIPVAMSYGCTSISRNLLFHIQTILQTLLQLDTSWKSAHFRDITYCYYLHHYNVAFAFSNIPYRHFHGLILRLAFPVGEILAYQVPLNEQCWVRYPLSADEIYWLRMRIAQPHSVS